jgi:hypothetical protein
MAGKLDQIIVIDIECTCWEEQPIEAESEIIKIGLCVVDVQRLERIAHDSLLVKPTRSRVSPFCTQLTSLPQAQLDTGIAFAAACHSLRQRYHTLLPAPGDGDRLAAIGHTPSQSGEVPLGFSPVDTGRLRHAPLLAQKGYVDAHRYVASVSPGRENPISGYSGFAEGA